MAILTLLDERRLNKQIKKNLTLEIVKNIKRDLRQNKVPFYRCEAGEEKYQHYETLINAFYREYK